MSSEQTKPAKFTPASLSQEEYRQLTFCVPIYQRLFAWGKKQIEKLLDDLLEAYGKDSEYYLGILTIAVRDGNLDLIDGQQRMIVTNLMAIAFKGICPGQNAYWGGYLNEGHRIEFSARDEDTTYILRRAKGENAPYKNPMMEYGIEVIKSWCYSKFQKDADKKGFDAEGCADFAKYVWNNMTLFCSYLPDKYVSNPIELNRYFEAVNSTGRQLQQHEILLVDLISGHPNSETLSKIWSKISDVNRKYIRSDKNHEASPNDYDSKIDSLESELNQTTGSDDTFLTIEQILPRKSDSRNNSSAPASKRMIITFEELLLMALRITTGGEHTWNFYKPEHLLARFQEADLKGTGKLDLFFKTLLKCRLLLDYKVIWQETEGNYDYELLTQDPAGRLEKFQSMLHVANSDSYYRWLPKYIQWLSDHPHSTAEYELEALKQIDRDLHPSLINFSESLCYPGIDRYWFWRLDYELWDHRNDDEGWLKDHPELKDIVDRYVFRPDRSIEHLHPRTPTDDRSERWAGYDLNRFGNLAMISSSFNSSQSNESAGVKMERVHHQIETSQLQSLKMLHMWITYRDAIETELPETWTEGKVDAHERVMLPYLTKIFQGY